MRILCLLLLTLLPVLGYAQKTFIVCQYDSAAFSPACFKGKMIVEGEVNFSVPGRYFIKMWCIEKGDTLSEDSAYTEVAALPEMNADTLPDLCDNDPAFSLVSYGNPTTGKWHSTTKPLAIINNTLYPNVLKAGTHWLTYKYTDPKTGCYDSDSSQITIKACGSGLREENALNSYRVSPNPANNWLILSGPVTNGMEISLVTPLGLEKKVTLNGNRISLENVPAGLFFLRISSGSHTYTLKCIKTQ
jgi:hypothetical protein